MSDDRRWLMLVVALYDYEPEEHDELGFEEGEAIRVLRVQDDGWWYGYSVERPSHRGLFPSNYVQQERSPRRQSPTRRPRTVQSHDDDDFAEEQSYRPSRQVGSANESLPPSEPDGDDQPKNPAPRGKMSTVLELRRSLQEAERAQNAARDARQQAERESRTHRRRGQPVREQDDEEEEEDQQQSRHQGSFQRRSLRLARFEAPEEEDDNDDDSDRDNEEEDDESAAYPQEQGFMHRSARDDEDQDDLQHDNDDVDNNDGDDGGDDDDEEDEDDSSQIRGGSFAVAAAQQAQMDAVIQEYQLRKEIAAVKVIRGFYHRREQQHKTALEQERTLDPTAHSLHHNESPNQQQRRQIASAAIQRWLLRTTSKQHRRQQRLIEREAKAAVQIQAWIRHIQAYTRWKRRVQLVQQALAASRAAEEQTRQEQERRDAERQKQERIEIERQELERHEIKRKEQERRRLDAEREDACRRQQQLKLEETEAINRAVDMDDLRLRLPRTPPDPRGKPRKKVMKKEAVDLVKVLVKQQLNESLREHDAKMADLQRMVTTLQDVIHQQSAMLADSSNQLLELERERSQAAAAQHSHHRIPPPRQYQQCQQQQHPPVVRTTRLPSTADRDLILPTLTPSVPASVPTRPTGLRPPRSIDLPTKLPVLVSGWNNQPPAIPKR